MKDFLARLLTKLIGERSLKGMTIADQLSIEMRTILSDNKWHHIGITTSAWVRRIGKKKFRVDDVAIFKDGKQQKKLKAIYKLSK